MGEVNASDVHVQVLSAVGNVGEGQSELWSKG